MRSGRGSTTAQLTALVRAALTGPTGTVNDPYAKLFLRFPWRSLVPVLGRKRIASLPLLRDAMALSGGRTCFFDEQLRLAIDGGVRQVVILGAGYDSRAIRFAGDRLRFFEVDHQATQAAKIAALARAGVAQSATLAAVDFEHDDLGATLKGVGFERTQPTFFLWEGVVEYLRREAVQKTLAALRGLAAPGSWLAFDPLHEYPSGRRLALLLGSLFTRMLGEPKQFRIDPEPLADFLQEAGWRLEQTVEVTELCERYLKRVIKRRPAQHNYVAVATPY